MSKQLIRDCYRIFKKARNAFMRVETGVMPVDSMEDELDSVKRITDCLYNQIDKTIKMERDIETPEEKQVWRDMRSEIEQARHHLDLAVVKYRGYYRE